ncbi:symmetrical bis(5'-nucleosyl)-tetraphosphatase [Spongiibacter sp. KMU-158]|uniref:bis(5'-nucleosyl)-tetraphosphatase (symmetrical) n=1 Tax=Spongiibacter pelagi TaxID=2760804 RepID=A0A927GW62_9GAMM|nr:symmetrical bis(5'-nucleosyl)-tetraphosphatase [Spongiibacter pelagi]MBD2858617.1 symmetrical bis(5'-nucleosyl)-tetraphosphatase [Spongiibacter pelagi]
MARYAIGDLQGCYQPLRQLLDQIAFDPANDQLWLVGDLVNRGPDSLETLRFLHSIRDSLRITLGNHDLHVIALAKGYTDRGRHPTLEALLNAPDCLELMNWLQQQRLAYRDPSGDYLMSHAGIPAIWSSEQALSLAAELEAVLQSDKAEAFFLEMYGNTPLCWSDDLHGVDRLRAITNYFTRMRACQQDGTLELKFKGIAADIPAGYRPWFEWQATSARKETLLFGHWAALECQTGRDDIIALDSGCVWGRCMTLLNLDTRELHHCDCSKP